MGVVIWRLDFDENGCSSISGENDYGYFGQNGAWILGHWWYHPWRWI